MTARSRRIATAKRATEAASSVTCCGGELRAEYWPESRCTETGYIDGGWEWRCVECGAVFNEMELIAMERMNER
jgi:hypothetical protein